MHTSSADRVAAAHRERRSRRALHLAIDPSRSCWASRLRALRSLLLTITPALAAQALEPAWSIVDHAVDAGVQNTGVLDLAEGRNGEIYLATSDGLRSFDGWTWTTLGVEHGLPSRLVRAVCVTEAGVLWVGTDQGAGTFSNGRFAAVAAEQLAGPSVRRIVEDSDGALWFCCDQWPASDVSAGLTVLCAGTWQSYRVDDGLPCDYVSDFVATASGRRFALTLRGIAELVDGTFRRPSLHATLRSADAYAWSLIERDDGSILVGTDGFLQEGRQDAWAERAIELPGHASNAVKLWQTRSGDILTYASGKEDRLLRWDGDRFVALSAALPGRATIVEQMLETRAGDVWIGGVGLLSCWHRSAREWSVVPGNALPCFVDGAGRTWFASDASCHYLHEGRTHAVPGLREPLVQALGGVCGRSGAGIACWRDGALVPEVTAGLDVVDVARLREAADGALWVAGHDRGGDLILARGDGTHWTTITVLPREGTVTSLTGAPGGGVHCIVRRGTASDLFEATANGVVSSPLPSVPLAMAPPRVFSGGGSRWLLGHRLRRAAADQTWEVVAEVSGASVSAAFENPSGVWFVCRAFTDGISGLACASAGGWRFFSSSAVDMAGTDTDGTTYLGGSMSTMIVVPSDSNPYERRLPTAGRVHRVVRGADDELWIGTDVGLFRWHATGHTPRTFVRHAPQSVPAGDAIALHVAGRRWGWPRQLAGAFQVSHRIGDTDWSEFVGLDDGVVVLPSLPIGRHRVEVRVRDETGAIDAAPPTVPVEVLAPRLETRWWFWMTVAGVLGTLGVLTGMTLRARAVHRAMRAEQRYRSVLDNSPICIHEIDAQGRLQSINAAGLRMLGVTAAAQVLGRQVVEFVAPEDRETMAGAVQRALQGVGAQLEFRSARGRHLLTALVPLPDVSGRSVRLIGLTQDVSEVHALAEGLHQAKKIETIGLLASGVAHDFNNLLTTMLGNVHLVREGQKHKAIEHGVDPLDAIELAGQRATEMTRQLMVIARKLPTETVVQDAGAALREIEPLLRWRLRSGTGMTTNVASEVPRVRLDPGQFAQVILNLVGNAVDAIAESGQVHIGLTRAVIDAATAARLQGVAPGEYAQLTVRDTGCGMTPETLARVCEPFFTTKPPDKGTGLGLTTVNGIVKRAHGHLEVTSRLHHGTEVSVWLPAAPADAIAAWSAGAIDQRVPGQDDPRST